MKITKYIEQVLDTYKKRHFNTYDPTHDEEDIQQDLWVFAIKLTNTKGYKNADKKRSYAVRCFDNFVKKWHTERRIRDKKMRYEDPQTLYEALKDWRYDSTRIPYFKLPVLDGLTKIEKRIITLKYMDGHKNIAIIEMLGYKHGETGIRQLISRVRKKLAKKYPNLVKK